MGTVMSPKGGRGKRKRTPAGGVSPKEAEVWGEPVIRADRGQRKREVKEKMVKERQARQVRGKGSEKQERKKRKRREDGTESHEGESEGPQ